MVDFHDVNEILESEKKRLISQLKKDSKTKDEIEFWTKTEKIQEDLYRRKYEDLYRRTEAATRKLFDEFKKEAKTIPELNFWNDIEQMRGAYHNPEEEGFACEDIEKVKEDKTGNEQDDFGNELFDESSNNKNETGNKPDGNGSESDENSQKQIKEAQAETKEQDFTQNAVVPTESSDSPPWITSDTLIYLPEVKPDEKSVIRFIYTTRPSSIAHIHQTEEPTWIDISLKKDTELDIPDKIEKKIMKRRKRRREQEKIPYLKMPKKEDRRRITKLKRNKQQINSTR